jgi:hypothetical protein
MKTLTALLPVLLLAACNSISVKSDYDPAYDFGGLETWAWLKPTQTLTPEQRADNRLASERIRKATEAELAAKGYELTAGQPDFWVVAHAVVQRRVDTDYVYTTYGYRAHGWGGAVGYAEPVTYSYNEGTLVIDVLRGTDKEMVWTGAASAVVDPDATPEKREQRIREAVAKLLAGFPPPAK